MIVQLRKLSSAISCFVCRGLNLPSAYFFLIKGGVFFLFLLLISSLVGTGGLGLGSVWLEPTAGARNMKNKTFECSTFAITKNCH